MVFSFWYFVFGRVWSYLYISIVAQDRKCRVKSAIMIICETIIVDLYYRYIYSLLKVSFGSL